MLDNCHQTNFKPPEQSPHHCSKLGLSESQRVLMHGPYTWSPRNALNGDIVVTTGNWTALQNLIGILSQELWISSVVWMARHVLANMIWSKLTTTFLSIQMAFQRHPFVSVYIEDILMSSDMKRWNTSNTFGLFWKTSGVQLRNQHWQMSLSEGVFGFFRP